jgi:hypothetical protein
LEASLRSESVSAGVGAARGILVACASWRAKYCLLVLAMVVVADMDVYSPAGPYKSAAACQFRLRPPNT